MSRVHMLGSLALLLVLLVGCVPLAAPATVTPTEAVKKPVLLIAQERSEDMELMLTKEVGVMVGTLEEAGYEVVVASESGRPIAGTTTTLQPDMKLADVKVDDYGGVIVPCMAAPMGSYKAPPEALAIVKSAAERGMPIAAQMSGVVLLGQAGILDGKPFAMFNNFARMVPGGVHSGEGVVQDGNIITSGICPYLARDLGRPDGTSELTQKLIAAMG